MPDDVGRDDLRDAVRRELQRLRTTGAAGVEHDGVERVLEPIDGRADRRERTDVHHGDGESGIRELRTECVAQSRSAAAVADAEHDRVERPVADEAPSEALAQAPRWPR